MEHPNQRIIDRYFEAYSKNDLSGIKEVMSENVTWYFLGNHPFSGVKKGINEVLAFYDEMGKIMDKSNSETEKLIVAENDYHLVECIHSKTNREDGLNLDHYACVLWTFDNGKIVEGRHFFADQEAVNKYFTSVDAKAA
jgi:ketosteroid isomerase-like protein